MEVRKLRMFWIGTFSYPKHTNQQEFQGICYKCKSKNRKIRSYQRLFITGAYLMVCMETDGHSEKEAM